MNRLILFLRFTKPPIGPFGKHIRLVGDAAKDKDIAQVIEVMLGRGLLQAFVINDQRDYKVLKEMLQSHNLSVKCWKKCLFLVYFNLTFY